MRILLVEDNIKLNDSLKYQLEKDGFSVDACIDGEEALYFIRQNIHDVILLDRMLPFLDGISVLKQIRQEHIHTPVILITALGTLEDKITGLNLGADDYLVKPFAYEELSARIRCITRRSREMDDSETLTFGDIVYHPKECLLKGPEKNCLLSKREGELLEALLRNKEQTLSRSILLTKVWGPDSDVEDGNLDNYIHFIRRRLKAVTTNVSVKTVRGIGYRLEGTYYERL